ncbi:MAG: helix-turn-helix transcriptional regulator [Actinobacteria bacterium]|nr:helix-turn-helix transcriptional regulator [Actinomycetota bacterium]
MAILGLLKERPMHGYELKKRLSYMLGHFWTVSYGSLYPALKRLERAGDIERAYSVREKTRHRNVYRITRAGENDFIKLLSDTVADNSFADNEKFDLRMAFFQYLEPETRLSLLEKRVKYLKEQIPKFKAYRSSNRDQDRYRTSLFRHKVGQAKSDIRWLERLIAQERDVIKKREGKSTKKQKSAVVGGEEKVRAASSA